MRILKQNFFLLIAIFLTSCSISNEYLPEEFIGLRLTKKVTGKEARNFVNKLHGKTVTETENEIGYYSGNAGRALIYTSHYQKPESAEKYFGKMTKKISLGKSAFVSSEFIDVNGKKIFRTFGMGRSHYIFTYNKGLFWITVDTNLGIKFVREYLSYLKNI